MPNHVTIAVYLSGSYKINVVAPEDLGRHLEYNRIMRPGRTLFLDGDCIQEGYLNATQIAEWTERISKMEIDTSKHTRPYQ